MSRGKDTKKEKASVRCSKNVSRKHQRNGRHSGGGDKHRRSRRDIVKGETVTENDKNRTNYATKVYGFDEEKEVIERDCLRCDQKFETHNKYNRVCSQCKNRDDWKKPN